MQIVKDLRGPDGCPWDKEQTHESLAPFAIEEVYELIESIERNDTEHFKEELGDVLFQVALHCQLAEELNEFSYRDVLQTLCEKLVRRHPHVFSDVKVKDINEVWSNWEKIKKQEKESKNKQNQPIKTFDFPAALPALQRAHKIGVKSEKLKFDWQHPDDVFNKVLEELNELKVEVEQNSAKEKIQEEFGDLLFSLAQWARHLNLEAEQTLRKANSKFENRFNKMMSLVSKKKLDWNLLSDSEKESLWQEIKNIN
ncbi:MAG: nucleoside triphosphate pyrophosphohydrolase [Bdellovibrionales bacterium]|nr:nucleoside triphosphate pyrophosphohydrolase [Bdellovibrionales bacterium]